MTLTSLLWLTGAMAVFVLANAGLRVYVASPHLPVLVGALLLFTCGNLMMVRIMREQGLALAIAVSSVLQLLLITAVAVLWFGERPAGTQLLGLIFGLVAVILIAWPQGGRA